MLDQGGVPRRVHPGGDGPDHVLPVAGVDVVVADDHELGVHELAQEGPDPQHHPLGVARVALLDGHHRHPVGAPLRRQVEVHDLGELLLQQRHEHLVERHPEHRRLIGRTAGVGAVVDGILAHRHVGDGKDRELVHLVVVAGVIAIRPFGGHLARLQIAFQHDLGAGGHLQIAADGFYYLGAAAAQQTGKGVFGEGIRHRRHRAEDGRRIGTERHHHREALTRVGLLPLAKIDGTAAVIQPAHDQLVLADLLLAIDAEVLPLLVGAAGDGQTPGHQRGHVARPAVLDRDLVQIDRLSLQHPLLTGSRGEPLGRHVEHLLEDRQLLHQLLEAAGRLRLLQVGEPDPHLAQGGHVGLAHAHGDPVRGAEQVGQHRHGITLGIFEQQGRPARPQGAVADLGHLQIGVYLAADALELSALFQLRDEITQILVFHAGTLCSGDAAL